jgi:thiol-disulfide isomerase/thioredoxin
MPGIVEVVGNLVRPYYYYILVITLLAIFGVISYYVYNNYYTNSIDNKFADVANANRRTKEAEVMFFHVDWCPHCKKALPEWNNFKKQYNDKEINGYIIKCIDIDCTNDTSDTVSLMNKFNIESYPTVKLSKDNNVIDFDSKITSNTLEIFVNTMLV